MFFLVFSSFPFLSPQVAHQEEGNWIAGISTASRAMRFKKSTAVCFPDRKLEAQNALSLDK